MSLFVKWQFVSSTIHSVYEPVQLKSWEEREWMVLSLRWCGWAHLGPPVVKPFSLSQSANQAMWQLQLKGLEMRLRALSDTSASKAPGVTQLMRLEYRLKLSTLTRPYISLMQWWKHTTPSNLKKLTLNKAPLTSLILFSDMTISRIEWAPSKAPSSMISILFLARSRVCNLGKRLNRPKAGTRVILLSLRRRRRVDLGRSSGNSLRSLLLQSTVSPSQ